MNTGKDQAAMMGVELGKETQGVAGGGLWTTQGQKVLQAAAAPSGDPGKVENLLPASIICTNSGP